MKKQNRWKAVRPEKTLIYYPLSYVVLYNAAVMIHFFLGAYAIVTAYDFLWFRHLFGLVYLLFAFITTYIVLPLSVCPHCPYFGLADSRCSSGLNIIANLITVKGSAMLFKARTKGPFSFDSLFTVGLLLPFVLIIPGFIFNFSFGLLAGLLLLLGSLGFRIFYLLPRISCSHCKARGGCPNYTRFQTLRKRLLSFTASGRNP
jgi:hypothetical protein